MIAFNPVDEFTKDLDKLTRKYRSLPEDLEVWKKAIQATGVRPDGNGLVKVANLGGSIRHLVYKVRHFRCKALQRGNRSGIRIIFNHDQTTDTINLIEIYYKSDQANHDVARIIKYSC